MLTRCREQLLTLRRNAQAEKAYTFDQEWQEKFGPLARTFL